ncbi:MAG: peptidylprolyl isomerase [Gammaproteobacteria bacterium]|nr:peptidylprolyl isomerase [Gammaproteobacteria bacterium]
MIGKLLREPLVHFLAIGAVLFLIYGLMNDGGPADDQIVVTQADIERMIEIFGRQWRRPPTQSELEGLINQQIREEVLFREALALGLDKDDTIIRRRLAQKMEFIAEDLSAIVEPTEEDLASFYTENADTFAEPAVLSFSHIYFSPDKRGAATRADAELVLQEMRAAGTTDSRDRGDRFLMQLEYRRVSEQDVATLFGSRFAAELFANAEDGWTGPIESGFGLHLVRITDREASRIPPLADVRERVLQEYQYAQKRAADEALVEGLKVQYEIIVEPIPSASDAAGAS